MVGHFQARLLATIVCIVEKTQKHFQHVMLVGMASEISKNYTYKRVDRSRTCDFALDHSLFTCTYMYRYKIQLSTYVRYKPANLNTLSHRFNSTQFVYPTHCCVGVSLLTGQPLLHCLPVSLQPPGIESNGLTVLLHNPPSHWPGIL